MKKNAAIVFCKLPVTGKVKTRLGKHCGMKQAATLYRFLTEKIIGIYRSIDCDLLIYADAQNAAEIDAVKNWLGKDLPVFKQHGDDIGMRMYRAFEQVFSLGYENIVLTGSDLPGLKQKNIEMALQQTKKKKVIFGPAIDGGYYLVAMQQQFLTIDMFRGVEYSGPFTLKQTLKKYHLVKPRVQVFLLPGARDLDDPADLQYHYTSGNFDSHQSLKQAATECIDTMKR